MNWDTWKKIVQIKMFFENKGFSIYIYVFCKQTYNIQGSTLQPLKTLKAFELTWLILETCLKFMNFIGSFPNKLGNHLFS